MKWLTNAWLSSLKLNIESGLSLLNHTQTDPARVVGSALHLIASYVSRRSICQRYPSRWSSGSPVPVYLSKTGVRNLASSLVSRISCVNGNSTLRIILSRVDDGGLSTFCFILPNLANTSSSFALTYSSLFWTDGTISSSCSDTETSLSCHQSWVLLSSDAVAIWESLRSPVIYTFCVIIRVLLHPVISDSTFTFIPRNRHKPYIPRTFVSHRRRQLMNHKG